MQLITTICFQGRIFYHCAGTKLTKKCNFWRWASKDEIEPEKAKENEENGAKKPIKQICHYIQVLQNTIIHQLHAIYNNNYIHKKHNNNTNIIEVPSFEIPRPMTREPSLQRRTIADHQVLKLQANI